MDADGSGNKRPTEKSEQKTKEEQHTASRLLPVRMLSSILWEGCFLKAGWSGQTANCAPSRKINPFFRPLANIRLCPVRCALSLCQHSVRLSAFLQRCSAKTFALGVLSLESIVNDFLPTFYFFFSFVDFSLLLEFSYKLLSIVVNDIQKFVCKFDVCNF